MNKNGKIKGITRKYYESEDEWRETPYENDEDEENEQSHTNTEKSNGKNETTSTENDKNWTDPSNFIGCGCLLIVGVLIVSGIVVFSHSVFPQSKWPYAIKYNTSSQYVDIEKKPHDCKWFTAPIGNKHCHYEKDIYTERDKQGRTWVYVSWDKVDE